VDQVELPNKLYFRIGEVARIVGVKPYVLRYWETEFSVLKPGKTPSRHRLYRRRDVEMLLEIKRLLYEEGFTIAGAKKRLKETEKDEAVTREEAALIVQPAASLSDDYRQVLRDIHEDLLSLHTMLTKKPA
jgi:DNA-binding transcriptional MerR regulator